MVTIAELAKALNLSTATISNALSGKGRVSDEKKRLIISTAARMGYDFQRIRAAEIKRNICVLTESITSAFCTSIVEGICRSAQSCDYITTIYNLDLLRENSDNICPDKATVAAAIQRFLANAAPSLFGLIYVSQYPRDVSGIMPALPYPIVYAYCYAEKGSVCVNTNDQQGAYIAVRHLIELKRRRIAMISGPIDSVPMIKRFYGYQRALLDAGIATDLQLMKAVNWDADNSFLKMQELLALDKVPDGVFCQNDAMAMGAIRAIQSAGLRVPEDIAVVGFDNSVIVSVTAPSITSVAPPFEEIGRQSFMLLQSILEKREIANRNILLDTKLVCRTSA